MAMQPPPSYAQQPAGPAPGVRYAGAGGRLIAYIIDGVIIGFIVSLFIVIGLGVVGAPTTDAAGVITFNGNIGLAFLIAFIGWLVAVLWKPFFWSRGGQTPGYKLLGMRLVRAGDGGPVGFGTAILRIIGYVISGMFFDLGFIWILFDGQKQGWHDKIAGTVVIQA